MDWSNVIMILFGGQQQVLECSSIENDLVLNCPPNCGMG